MASVAPTQAAFDAGRSHTRRRSWLSEPLLHFVILGGLLFAVVVAIALVNWLWARLYGKRTKVAPS